MGEKDLYEYWSNTYKTQALDWSPATAKQILAEWQQKFSDEVKRMVEDDERYAKRYQVDAFSTSNLETALDSFSELSTFRVAVGLGFMVRRMNYFLVAVL